MLAILMFVTAGSSYAQDKGKSDSDNAPAKDDLVKVEVALATEHAPEGLKANSRVHLNYVVGKAVTRNGTTRYTTNQIVKDVEVISVTQVEKPNESEQAVKVELRVTKDQADKIEKYKTHLVTVVETIPGGGTVTKKKPVPLRLELVTSAEKK